MEGRDIIREANLEEFEKTPTYVDTFGMESHAPSNLGAKYTVESFNKLSPEERIKARAAISKEIPRGNSLYKSEAVRLLSDEVQASLDSAALEMPDKAELCICAVVRLVTAVFWRLRAPSKCSSSAKMWRGTPPT